MMRWIRAILNAISFGFVRRAEEIEKDPNFIDGSFEEGIREKEEELLGLGRAAARIEAAVETVAAQVESTKDEIEALEKERAGALELGKKQRTAVERAGGNPDEDKRYLELLQGFEAAETDLVRQQEALVGFEEQLATLRDEARTTDLQLTEAQRAVESLRAERGSVVAGARFAKMMRDLNEAKARVSSESADAKIQKARDNARLLKSEAKVASRMSGADAKVRRAELRQAATTSMARDRFSELTGGTKAVTEAPAAVAKAVAEAPAASDGAPKGGSLPR